MPRTRAAGAVLLTVAAIVYAVVVALLTTLPAAATPTPDAPGRPRTVLLRTRAVPLTAGEIANPMRGEYQWLGSSPQPAEWPSTDVYYRDQVAWKRIEPSPGVYDFTWFDTGLARAHELHGRFGFRVMAWCPGCWLDATPSWLPRQPGTDIPDWDSEAFLAGWDRLMTALGDRYGADPALGWVDVGGYGSWGEWHVVDGAEISTPGAVRVMTSVLTHFPKQHVVVNAMVPRYVDAAMALSPRMGLRVDCLGEFNMFSLLPTSPALQERWKTAPVLSEWCGTAATSTTRGADQVRQFHISQVASPNGPVGAAIAQDPAALAGFTDAARSSGYRYVLAGLRVPRKLPRSGSFPVTSLWRNDGSAPTYEDWRVTLQVRKKGAVVRSTDLGVDLRSVLPGPATLKGSVALGALKPGRYSLWVTVTDPAGYLAPMNLAITGRRADGAYPLGMVRVTRTAAHRREK